MILCKKYFKTRLKQEKHKEILKNNRFNPDIQKYLKWDVLSERVLGNVQVQV